MKTNGKLQLPVREARVLRVMKGFLDSFQAKWNMIMCDSFPLDFQRDGIQFGLKSKTKLSPRSYSILSIANDIEIYYYQCERFSLRFFLNSLKNVRFLLDS